MKNLARVFIVLLTGLAVLESRDGNVMGVLIFGGLGLAWVLFYPRLKKG